MVEVLPVEGCLDSAPVREYRLSEPVGEPLMRSLAEGARLDYYPHFPKPYFRIDRPKAYVIQGVLGADSFRVTFTPSAGDSVEDELRCAIER